MINHASLIDPSSALTTESEAERHHIATLLACVEKHAHISQRLLASELGVALGLVNTYVRRCAKKGFIKIQQAPSRRYTYYLTPKGFAEKSRLTAEYLSWSLTFFRHARAECNGVLDLVRLRGWKNIALLGSGDLAEIMLLSATEKGIAITAVVDHAVATPILLGRPILRALHEVTPMPDGWIVTTIIKSQATYDSLAALVGPESVLTPPMLGISLHRQA